MCAISPTVYVVYLETRQVFTSWFEYVHVWFGYNPRISFCHLFYKLYVNVRLYLLLFSQVNLVIFRRYNYQIKYTVGTFVFANPPTVVCQFFWNLIGVFVLVWRCVCVFLYNLQNNFCHFFQDVNIEVTFLSMSVYRRYLVYATTPTVFIQFFLKLCIRVRNSLKKW